MKKTKILIPALSIASVGAVVVPMVTSCNSSFMTITDGNFVGTVHDEVKAENAWSQIKASEEYFKDKKYIAEDFATFLIQSVQEMGKEQYEDFTLENLKVEPVINFKSLNIGKQIAMSNKVGYLLSGSLDAKIKFSFDGKPKDSTSAIEKVHIDMDAAEIFEYNDCLASLAYKKEDDKWYWELSIDGVRSVSTNWWASQNVSYTMTSTTTLKAGGSVVYKIGGGDTGTYSAKTAEKESQELLEPIASNYLSKVAGPTE